MKTRNQIRFENYDKSSLLIFPRNILAVFACSFFLLLLSGCVTTPPAPTSNRATEVRKENLTSHLSKGFDAKRVNLLAVLPFTTAPQSSFMPQAKLESLSEELLRSLELKSNIVVINKTEPTQTAGALKKVLQTTGPERSRAQEFGKSVGAQGVLYGQITKFDESLGSRYGAEKPASVSFHLYLIDPQTGKDLWAANYENSEQALSDNLFRMGEKLKKGFGFRSATELILEGFSQAAEQLQRLREQKNPD